MMNMLFILAEMRVREDAENIASSDAEIRVSLSQWATFRRIPIIMLGLFLLVPLGGFIALVWYDLSGPARNANQLWRIVLLLLAIGGIYIFIMGVRRFWLDYGFGRQAFTREGLRLGKRRLIGYDKLALRLYRKQGKIITPLAGVLEVVLPHKSVLYFGAERENFFMLPYILEKWAPDSFVVLPILHAPKSVKAIMERDKVWTLPREDE